MNILEARRRLLDGEIKKRTAEGENISVRSVSRMRPGLTLYGKSEQETTTGAQLLDIDSLTRTSTDTEGNITQNPYRLSTPKIQRASYDYYILSGVTEDVFPICTEYDASNTFLKRTFLSRIYANELQAETQKFIITFYKNNEVTVEASELANVMINAGTTALPWEPYTGGAPSPSPDYPQEIKSVGDSGKIEVTVAGAQLFDVSSFPDNAINKGITITNNHDGSFTVSGTKTQTGGVNMTGGKLTLPAGTYTLSGNTNGLYVVLAYDGSYMQNNVTRTFESETEFQMYIQANETQDETITIFPMLNHGSSALPYEPYRLPKTLPVQTPNGLPGIPVSSGGNYTDANGQQWVCDEIDLARGKYVQRTMLRYFRNMTWFKHSLNGSASSRFYSESLDDAEMLVNTSILFNALSNEFTHPIDGNMLFNQEITAISGYDEGGKKLFAKIVGVTELDDFLEKTQNAYIVYQLAAPIETDLPAEELAAYKALHTYSPTTTVSNDAGAWMKLGYKTKKSLEVID